MRQGSHSVVGEQARRRHLIKVLSDVFPRRVANRARVLRELVRVEGSHVGAVDDILYPEAFEQLHLVCCLGISEEEPRRNDLGDPCSLGVCLLAEIHGPRGHEPHHSTLGHTNAVPNRFTSDGSSRAVSTRFPLCL